MQIHPPNAQSQFASSQALDDLNVLRLIAAIHDTGTLAGAAKRLGVNHATVFRRITAIESDLGVRLFERQRGRYCATPAGEELARTGAEIENLAVASLRRVAGHDTRPNGVVRIATTDSIASSLLPPILRKCRVAYPEIRLEVTIANAMHDLSKGEADIAVRPAKEAPETVIGKKISVLAFAVYGAKTYLQGRSDADLHACDWIAMEGAQSQHRALTRHATVRPPEQVGFVFSTFTGVAAGCASGLGLAVLPCFLGDSKPELEKVASLPDDSYSKVWLLVHPDLYKVARVKAAFTLLHGALKEEADLIAGKTVTPRTSARHRDRR